MPRGLLGGALPSATRGLLAGAGIGLESTGSHDLKGIDEPDDLFRVVVAA